MSVAQLPKWFVFAASLAVLASCSTTRSAVLDPRDPRYKKEDDAPLPPPVTVKLIRVAASGKEIETHRNVLLVSDTVMRMHVENHTGSSLYLRVEQTPNNEGVVPVDAAVEGSGASLKGDNLYKIDSDPTVDVDFPIHRGLRDSHIALHLSSDSAGEKEMGNVGVDFRIRPGLAFYGEDDFPLKMHEGAPVFEFDRSGGDKERGFYVEMIPGPADATTCVVAVETVADDGVMLSQVKATLSAPAYRDGPFHAVAGSEVRPNIHRLRRTDLVEGDPGDEVVSPAPRDRSDLIATGEIHVRRLSCQ